MAVTYATNAEIRATFPQIDNLFPKTKLNGLSTSPATSLTVDSTDAFPLTGTLALLSTTNVLTSLDYSGKSSTVFFLSSATAVNFSDNAFIGTGDYQIDYLRTLGKAWVDARMTNPHIPADHKKDVEARYVYYRALKATMDINLHSMADGILADLLSWVADLKKEFPPQIRQNIIWLAEEGLSDLEKDIIRNGPSNA